MSCPSLPCILLLNTIDLRKVELYLLTRLISSCRVETTRAPMRPRRACREIYCLSSRVRAYLCLLLLHLCARTTALHEIRYCIIRITRYVSDRSSLPSLHTDSCAGSCITTKHGNVNTDFILFIASGAFHSSKPSDLLAELQVQSWRCVSPSFISVIPRFHN